MDRKGYGRTMKKQWISALLVLLLMLLIPVTASADVIYPAPEAFVAGEEVDHLLATLDPGGTAWTDPELLPEGLRLETVESEEGVNVYLRGVPAVPGVYDLVIRYNGVDSLLTLTVVEGEAPSPTPVSVSVETLPLQLAYTAGDTLDPAGLSLAVLMSDGSTQVVSEGYTLYPTRLEQAGARIIEVNYEGLLCYFEVEVAPAPEEIEGIGVLRLPDKIVYDVGDELDPSGLVIRVYTNNGTRDQTTELLCEPTLLTVPGQQEITVFYEDKTCSFTVQVLEEEAPASIAVYRLPDRLDYTVGDTLDTSGLILVETSSRNNPNFVEDGFTCEPQVLENPGSQEIVVRRDGLQCSFHVNVRQAPAVLPPDSTPIVLPVQPTVPILQPDDDLLPQRGPGEELHSGKTLVAVIAAAAFLALIILGIYVFVMNRGGREFFADSVREVFRRRK